MIATIAPPQLSIPKLAPVKQPLPPQTNPITYKKHVYSSLEPFPSQIELPTKKIEEDLPFSREKWFQQYRSLEYEYDIENIPDTYITGKIPNDLQGTMYRMVPAGLHAGKTRFKHFFDGDGMICAVDFKGDGTVAWKNRYVRTEGWLKEREEMKVCYKNTFGTQVETKDGGGGMWDIIGRIRGLLDGKNVANTNVVFWGGKLLALWEGGLPYLLDKVSLDTVGEDVLGGSLSRGSLFSTGWNRLDKWIGFGESFTAHPKVHKDRLIGFNYTPTINNKTRLRVLEYDRKWNVVSDATHVIPRFAFIHDFCVTENYYVFVINPVTLKIMDMIKEDKTAGECIDLDKGRSTRIFLIPRDGISEPKIVQCDAFFSFHHANAYEDEDGMVVLDTVRLTQYPGLELLKDGILNVDFDVFPSNHIFRYRVDPKQAKQISSTQTCKRNVEFPTINTGYVGKKARYTWVGESLTANLDGKEIVKSYPMQGYARYDLETGEAQRCFPGSQYFINELTFASKKNSCSEDDGYLIGLLYNADKDRSEVMILDGKAIHKGPLATIHLPFHVPPGLHTEWVPSF
eukprot:Plantae.Rhodophyta-Hildenbrandia_rubra.ctg16683.p1 GENE.Plantae.Rhodophyta-Hildenbrandia_rubra.ctg16683~~Plantae.Rhodophyta-Hildenbrandia_rubra.ctg16683.p1  ORF type:complete len:570 (-),score=80.52 Plantae.Rhodophyta-Hildenbrandia_rubra.ctg16683:2288-3997(-)